MCDATAITMAVISIASAAATMEGQAQNAKAQGRYQKATFDAKEQQRKDNRKLATRNAILKQDALNEQLAQKRSALSEKKQSTQRKKLQAKSKEYTSGYENNAIGGSLTALLGDFDRQEGVFMRGLDMNMFFNERNIDVQKESEREIAMGRMASIQPYIPAPVAQPNFMAAALNVASDGVGIYDGYNKRTNPDYFGGGKSLWE
jgi:hypothetical protein